MIQHSRDQVGSLGTGFCISKQFSKGNNTVAWLRLVSLVGCLVPTKMRLTMRFGAFIFGSVSEFQLSIMLILEGREGREVGSSRK